MREPASEVSVSIGRPVDVQPAFDVDAQRLLERIALGVPLSTILHELVGVLETVQPGRFGQIRLLDGRRLRHAASAGLPAGFVAAVASVPVGMVGGSCGAAISRAMPVITTDVETDPLWADLAACARAHSVCSAWSFPFFDEKGNAVGTFVSYGSQRGAPREVDLQWLATLGRIAAIAIARDHIQSRLDTSDAMVRQSPDGIIVADLAGNITRWDGSAGAMYGYESSEILGADIATLLDRRLGGRLFERVRTQVREAGIFDETIPCLSKAGAAMTVELRASALTNADDKVVGVLMLARDITERRAAAAERSSREAQRASRWEAERARARLRDTLMDAPFLVVIVEGPEFMVRFLNAAVEKHPCAPQVAGKSLREFLDHLAPEANAVLTRVYETGVSFDVPEYQEGPRDDGAKRRFFDLRVQRLTGEDGLHSLIIFATDVTDKVDARQRMEVLAAAAQVDRERFNRVTHSAEVGIWISDPPFEMVRGDVRAFEHHGLKGEGLVDTERFFESIHGDDRERVRHAISGAIYRREDYDIEYRILSGDDSPRWTRAIGRSFTNEEGVVLRFDGITMDITSQKRAAEALEQSHRLLAANERLAVVGSLVSGVAHEIRTPLTYLATYVHLAQRGVEQGGAAGVLPAEFVKEIGQILGKALEGSDRALHIVNDLRRFVVRKEDGGALRGIDPVVSEAVDIFAAVQRGSIVVERRLQSARKLMVDRVAFQQVILNLLSNAAEAMPKGGRVTIRTVDTRDGVEVAVEDDGPGFSLEAKQRLFDPFFTTKRDGMGLGLSIAHRIVGEHGGTIRLRSAESGGACMVVSLPRIDSARPSLSEERDAHADEAGGNQHDGGTDKR